MVCCGTPMEPAGEGGAGVAAPTLEELVGTVFDISETELDVCLCVMEDGEQTAAELAERIEYDRSVVSRHLNHLAELGVVEKRRRILDDGGQVYVYSPEEPAVVRERLAGAFLAWAREATSLIESLSREKVAALLDSDAEPPR